MSERYKSREEADAAMKAAFDAIGTAATLLQMADVQRAAEQRPLRDGALTIVARGARQDPPPDPAVGRLL